MLGRMYVFDTYQIFVDYQQVYDCIVPNWTNHAGMWNTDKASATCGGKYEEQ